MQKLISFIGEYLQLKNPINFSNPVYLFIPTISLLFYQKQKEIREPAKA